MAADLFDRDEAPLRVEPFAPPSRPNSRAPLAERLRPGSLEEVVGQQALLGPEGPLGRMLAAGRLASIILWGPPGVGKTTIARLLAERASLHFRQISAIFSGVAELKKVFAEARALQNADKGVMLFVDEIHRFNRAQQDAFLPVMEEGLITLVGATTENPSFALNSALLSRAQVMMLSRLDDAALERLLCRAEETFGAALPLSADGRAVLRGMADGDGRALLTLADEAFALTTDAPLDGAELSAALVRRAPVYDRAGDGHYGLISALHKSVRGSDPDAALYWLCRMFAAGEDPLYVARRVVRMAVEDIGLADPNAMSQANAAKEAYEFLGSPEGELAIAQAVVYLATAPKSNAGYIAYKAAMRDAKGKGAPPPPAHILNAPTELMKEQGFGAGYAYDHDAPGGFSGQDYFPDGFERPTYYEPVERGFERELKKRMEWFARTRQARAEK
ncbi:MAG: replication-associated recombination protein A [Neomegalonema sp.]|nr:replication-associated recombination protein A [Neomegalonema sp.]